MLLLIFGYTAALATILLVLITTGLVFVCFEYISPALNTLFAKRVPQDVDTISDELQSSYEDL